jgi:hypothetical protein
MWNYLGIIEIIWHLMSIKLFQNSNKNGIIILKQLTGVQDNKRNIPRGVEGGPLKAWYIIIHHASPFLPTHFHACCAPATVMIFNLVSPGCTPRRASSNLLHIIMPRQMFRNSHVAGSQIPESAKP